MCRVAAKPNRTKPRPLLKRGPWGRGGSIWVARRGTTRLRIRGTTAVVFEDGQQQVGEEVEEVQGSCIGITQGGEE